jgi:hypothetical protein
LDDRRGNNYIGNHHIKRTDSTSRNDFLHHLLSCWPFLETFEGYFKNKIDDAFSDVFSSNYDTLCGEKRMPTRMMKIMRAWYKSDPMYALRSLYDGEKRESYDVQCVDCGCGMFKETWEMQQKKCARCLSCYCSDETANNYHRYYVDDRDVSFLVACANGHTDVVATLLRERTDIDINQRNITGMTPLMLAVTGNYCEIVEILLDVQGIDITLKDKRGLNALDIARQRYGTKDIIHLFRNIENVLHVQTFRDYETVHIGKLGKKTTILKATYGSGRSDRKLLDCTSQIQNLVSNGVLLVVGGIHTEVGDPEYGTAKKFEVHYKIEN